MVCFFFLLCSYFTVALCTLPVCCCGLTVSWWQYLTRITPAAFSLCQPLLPAAPTASSVMLKELAEPWCCLWMLSLFPASALPQSPIASVYVHQTSLHSGACTSHIWALFSSLALGINPFWRIQHCYALMYLGQWVSGACVHRCSVLSLCSEAVLALRFQPGASLQCILLCAIFLGGCL